MPRLHLSFTQRLHTAPGARGSLTAEYEMKTTLKESLGVTVLPLLMSCVLVGLLAGCATHPPIAAELKPLQGYWEGEGAGGKCSITITGNSLHYYARTDFWFETTFTLSAGTDPQQLHATIKDNAPSQGSNAIGKVVVALFKIHGGTLTLAARGDGSEETPISFEDEKVTRYELRKVQPQKNTQPPNSK